MVERELRVLSRRPATYRWRLVIGGVAFGLALLLLATMGITGGPQRWGQSLFTTLSVYAAFVCVLAGLFGTADLISEERREGTLGLLFLTDLKGYDVVLGKFSAVALNTFYWLFSLVPVLAMPLLIGGVTFAEVARISLALFNLLFFTMALGTWASVRSVAAYRSLSLAGSLLVMFCIVIPLWFSFKGSGSSSSLWQWFACSPVITMNYSSEARFATQSYVYWYSLLSTHLIGWLCLLFAIFKIPHVWQQTNADPSGAAARGKLKRLKATTFAERAIFLEDNPALLLMRAPGLLRGFAYLLAFIAVVITIIDLVFFTGGVGVYVPVLGGALDWLLLLPLKILLVIQACRFFAESRQVGAFELLLSTPLTIEKLLDAHWKSLNRTLGVPYAIVLICIGVEILRFSFRSSQDFGLFFVISAGSSVVIPIVDYFLIGWMGAWMALKCKKPGWAPFFTLLFALVLPAMTFFICFIGFFAKPILLTIARHNVVYEFNRLLREQFDFPAAQSKTEGATPITSPSPLS